MNWAAFGIAITVVLSFFWKIHDLNQKRLDKVEEKQDEIIKALGDIKSDLRLDAMRLEAVEHTTEAIERKTDVISNRCSATHKRIVNFE